MIIKLTLDKKLFNYFLLCKRDLLLNTYTSVKRFELIININYNIYFLYMKKNNTKKKKIKFFIIQK